MQVFSLLMIRDAAPAPATLRDTVVIGTSAGGIEALPRLVGQLPATFPAAVVIAQHMAVVDQPMLVHIIARASAVPVAWAEQGGRLEPGRVYVAPPGVHVMIVDGHLALMGGAKENHARPSIDRLFRSAAATHGARTIGVLLTGTMDDGVAGLAAIRDVGGVTIVQDPADAAFSELPERALQRLAPDHVLALDQIGPLLQRLTRARTAEPRDVAPLVPQASRSYQDRGGLEAALWSAIRALHERAATLDALADDSQRLGGAQTDHHYRRRAAEARAQAAVARDFMLAVATRDPEPE